MALAYGQSGRTAGDRKYRSEVESWRKEHEQHLVSDLRLMIVGRFELQDGKHTLGSDASNDIVIPAGPARIGSLELHGGIARIEFHNGVAATFQDKPARVAEFKVTTTSGGKPDIPVWIGSVGLGARTRNQRTYLTAVDKQIRLLGEWKRLRWFPIQEQYRIVAKFVPFDKRASLSLPDSDGSERQYPSPGYVSFTLDGRPLTLQPIELGKTLFFVLRDGTSGRESYGAGRFLIADPPENGTVVLDFNKATNPLCDYNSFVICPMPPRQNRLSPRILAGEMDYQAYP